MNSKAEGKGNPRYISDYIKHKLLREKYESLSSQEVSEDEIDLNPHITMRWK